MSLATLPDARAQLNKLTGVDDTELQGFLDAASERILHETGPIESTQYVERHDGGDVDIMLYRCPVLTVTSVVEWRGSGSHVLTEQQPGSVNEGFQLDARTGQLARVANGGWPRLWWDGRYNIVVTYTAGYAAVPKTVRLATLMLTEHLWRHSQNRSGRPQPGMSGSDGPVTSYALPRAVKGMLAPYLRAPEIG